MPLADVLDDGQAKTRPLDVLERLGIVDPIENPRYILVRRQTWKNIRQADYHAVPSIISAKRETVETFAGLWRRYVGDCDIVYTRSIEGRKLLLKAKNASYSSALKRGNARLTKRI